MPHVLFDHDDYAPKGVLIDERKDLKYHMQICWSEEDDAFLVKVPDLPGCMADGPTDESAIENAVVVTNLWIESAESSGEAVPQPTKVDVQSVNPTRKRRGSDVSP